MIHVLGDALSSNLHVARKVDSFLILNLVDIPHFLILNLVDIPHVELDSVIGHYYFNQFLAPTVKVMNCERIEDDVKS